MADAIDFISLGAGVQSTTLLLMACHGEIEPKPKYAIFSDTGWEPKHVYEHLEWLEKEVLKFGVAIIRTSKGNIRQDILDSANGGADGLHHCLSTHDPQMVNSEW